jgi:hypothetical protein
MKFPYTQVEAPEDFEGAREIWSCNDCGAYADKPTNINHHDSCTPGESKKWEKIYGEKQDD